MLDTAASQGCGLLLFPIVELLEEVGLELVGGVFVGGVCMDFDLATSNLCSLSSNALPIPLATPPETGLDKALSLLPRLSLWVELLLAILIKSSKLTLGGGFLAVGGGVLLLREDEAAGAILLEGFWEGRGESDFEVLVLTAVSLSFFENVFASFWPLDGGFFADGGNDLEPVLLVALLVPVLG